MIYKYIFFILLIFVVGCQSDCQDAKYFDLEYTNERIELLFSNDNAEFFDHFDSSNQFAYKWITNKNELTEYLQHTQLKLRTDTSKLDSFDFEHYNLFAIIYWEGCTNARHHIEQCSIAFSVGGRYSDTHYEEGQAARKTEVKDKYLLRHEFAAAPGSDKRMKENAAFMEDAQLWMQLKANMPDNTREAVQKILDLKGITQEVLAARLGVSRKALNKWCMQDRMSINHMVGICVALKLPTMRSI